MTNERKEKLQRRYAKFRNGLIDLLHNIQIDHPDGSLSRTEILTSPYFEVMNVNPKNPEMEGWDHLTLSKGHTVPMLYLVSAERGFFPKKGLEILHQINSMLQDHPRAHKIPGVELFTGPLGLGFSAGLDMAMTDRIKGLDSYTYVVMDDGRIEEGCTWEVAMSTLKFGVDHLIGILSNNGVQLGGTLEEIMPMGDTRAEWRVFEWNVVTYDGHDVEDFCRAVEQAERAKGQPSLILANTVEGKGVSLMEGKNA